MRKIYAAGLLDLLPESILLDPKLRASAEALNAQLQAVTAATKEVLHLPRLDELSGDIIDYLAEQFHIDFMEPLYLTETEKKNLIRESIAWHRIKGTPAAVEKIAHDAFRDSEILEWFDYGGEPYHFKIKSRGFKETPDGWATFTRMINAAKNVRSWCDNLEVDYSTLIEPAYGFVADAAAWAGIKSISLARPPNRFKTKFFAGDTDFTFGNKILSLQRPQLDGRQVVHVGQLLTKSGKIIFFPDPDDKAPYLYFMESPLAELLLTDTGFVREGRFSLPVKNYWRRQEAVTHVGTSDFTCGLRVWSLPRPPDELTRNFAGQGFSFVGTMKIAPDFVRKRRDFAIVSAGMANLRTGYIRLDSSTESSIDPHRGYVGLNYKTDSAFVGNAVAVRGDKDFSLHIPNFDSLMTIRVGQYIYRAGKILVNASTADLSPYTYHVESPLAELLLSDAGFAAEGRKSYPVLTYEREFEAPVTSGAVDFTFGSKVLGLPRPHDEIGNGHFGLANGVGGQVEIKPVPTDTDLPTKFFTGTANSRRGSIQLGKIIKPDEPEKAEMIHAYTTNATAATSEFIFGGKEIKSSGSQTFPIAPNLIRIRVGQPFVRAGEIKIMASELPPWEDLDDLDELGNFLRLWFDFPNRTRRTVLLKNPREDLAKADIREVGSSAADDGILLNSAGQSASGISLAALIRRTEQLVS